MLVGEQPGVVEDRHGAPFLGPTGRLLDEALVTAGIPREQIYLTNAVKHFTWVPRGKRRLHQQPAAAEIQAGRPWLQAEYAALASAVIVASIPDHGASEASLTRRYDGAARQAGGRARPLQTAGAPTNPRAGARRGPGR